MDTKLCYWLIFALAVQLGCGTDDTGGTSTAETQAASAGDGRVASSTKRDAGTSAAPVKKDGGPSKQSNAAGPANTPVSTSADPDACEKLQLPAHPNSPDILIVLDRSGSMIGLAGGANRWDPSISALKKLTASLTETVAFGLMLFPAPSGGAGGANMGVAIAGTILDGLGIPIPGLSSGGGADAASCAAGALEVPVDINSAGKIASVLDSMSSRPDIGSTPTTVTLQAAQAALDTGTCGDCPVTPKYVLLVTDGQPTCGGGGATVTAQADLDAVNSALDGLTAAGIKTFVIGYDTASDPATAAAMDGFAMHGGTDHQYPVENEQTLVDELTAIAGSLVPCEFELTGVITDPNFVRVEIDGKTYVYGTDWTIDGMKIILDPMGGACPKLRDAKLHNLRITRECEPVLVL